MSAPTALPGPGTTTGLLIRAQRTGPRHAAPAAVPGPFTPPAQRAPGSAAGLLAAARLPRPRAATTPPAPPVPLEQLPALAARIDTGWVATTGPTAVHLHHVDLDVHQLSALAGAGVLIAPSGTVLLLTCGQITGALALPGPLQTGAAGPEHAAPRCFPCTAATS